MQNRPLASAGVILTGMLVIGWIDQFVRVIAESSSLWSFHIQRSAMMWALALIAAAVVRYRLRVRNWRGVIARSLFMTGAMYIYFGALAFIPVAQASAGLFSSPIWVLIFSVLIFKLRIGFWRILAVALGFSGIILVLFVDGSGGELVSPLMGVPVLAGALYAMAVIATREWCPEEGALELSLAIFAMMAFGGAIVATVLGLAQVTVAEGADGFLTRGFVWPNWEGFWWTVVQAVGSLFAVLLLTRGYQLSEASYATVFEYSLLIFSAFFGWWVWGDTLGLWGWIGLGLIATAGTVIAVRSRAVT